MSDTPITDDVFDALSRRACGTAYVKAKMQELERSRDAFAEAYWSVGRALGDDEPECAGLDYFAQRVTELRAELARVTAICNHVPPAAAEQGISIEEAQDHV